MKTAAATVPPAFDIMTVLANATAPTSKVSSKVLGVQVPEGVKILVKRKQEIVQKLDALEAENELVSGDIIEQVTPIYEQKCANDFTSSLKVPSTDGTNITISWKSAYSKIPASNEATIQAIVGDSYGRWFTKVTEITVKDQSPEFLTKLIALVGAENFAKYFGVEQNIVPTANFTEEKYRSLTAEKRAELAPMVKQYKPAIRAK